MFETTIDFNDLAVCDLLELFWRKLLQFFSLILVAIFELLDYHGVLSFLLLRNSFNSHAFVSLVFNLFIFLLVRWAFILFTLILHVFLVSTLFRFLGRRAFLGITTLDLIMNMHSYRDVDCLPREWRLLLLLSLLEIVRKKLDLSLKLLILIESTLSFSHGIQLLLRQI